MTMQMEGKKLGGRYEIVSRVGGGGMAVVYKAKDVLLNRYVAIKVLSESLSNDSEFIRRFSREAQAAASLSHPNIVNVYDVGRDHFTHYIVMELVEGPTLKQYIQERGPLPVQEAATIAVQICDGLAHAHENQIVHRDIKPHNILLGPNGRAKVTDFGIARAASSSTITQQGSVMGSVHYFSPEQARGGVIGEKSDLYSLGIVLYEMLTGRIPFDGDSAISIALKHLQETPEDPRKYNSNIPDNVAEIVMKALSKNPEDRFESARDMMKSIQYAVQLTPHMEANWVNHQRNQGQEMFQTIPLNEESSNNDEQYESPVQRPEIRSGKKEPSPQKGQTQGLGERTLTNLERLKNVSGDKEKTVLQRTVVWLENVQAKLPWWQKLLFGLFTIAVIVMLSIWGFTTVWGLFTGDGSDSEQQQAQENVIPTFATEEDAVKFAESHGLGKPEISYVEGDPGKVVEQSPKPGTEFSSDTKIKLKVGIDGVMVKDYRGEFESNLPTHDNGYKIQAFWCSNGTGPENTVFKQKPAPGTTIKEGETVEVYLNTPKVKGSGCFPKH
ncbi:Stk1 family PASTA domain-containing Ser/Thr kinase [Thermoactinomyces intermedius]|uniref:Serine/threonine-protein kinase PrkC n=2 Tax=Thermoactinomycetaceae TaxID=186824 RepID=A0A8I1ABT3_THEIN|nr:Stk1 family PASTA domain-containing Ser/Thr kinase [Thermoactinomyces intermedius]MBA4836069.1 Stk1 family PASTA domain-containing Ser/Thr kinase [Thermoactinomyces intermedius]MBH8594265.1 Stk1 family PASTA domain-containing Ser/Thr kinase [Thermoactinomyces intermedius]MBH8601101.1 Stk1 family PASTA domain-containing Ser/Thr kinase [Thermoactinomyces sp. CICC 23799]